jgi:aminoglycoside phosphotransferase (APT) family kinase protein
MLPRRTDRGGRIRPMDRAAYLQQLHAKFEVPRPIVVDLVERATGGAVGKVERLTHGDENEVYRVMVGESVVFARIRFPDTPAGMVRNEACAMQQARAAGVPAPEVLAVETLHDGQNERQAMVVTEVPGQQLDRLLPTLSTRERAQAMTDAGRILRSLHSVRTPGAGVPDQEGNWLPADEFRDRYIATRVAECERLPQAGFTVAEIDQAIALLRDIPECSDPVLCHGDISPVHLFVDSELRVCGLIDWGLWRGGTAIEELASVAFANSQADAAAIFAGHGVTDDDPDFRRPLTLSIVPQAIAQIGWLVHSRQTAMLGPHVAALRRALNELSA